MAKFYFVAKVRRVVEDTISLAVETEAGRKTAQFLASHVAEHYPGPIEDGEDVVYCYVENRDNIESELMNIELVRPDDSAAA